MQGMQSTSNKESIVSELPRKYYCYRHRPDLQKARMTNEPTMEELSKVCVITFIYFTLLFLCHHFLSRYIIMF